jgi:hypothetical protein
MKDVKLTGDYAYIDIKTGRSKVLKALKDETHTIPVTLTGHILDAFSGDDGVSIMFTIKMDKFKLGQPKKAKQ